MGTHNLNTGVPRGTVNTTTVWDRIVKLETKTENVPDDVKEQLEQKAKQTDLNSQSSRIDNLVMNAGDLSNNSELIDQRVDVTGTKHTTAGNSIRYGQSSQLFNYDDSPLIKGYKKYQQFPFENGGFNFSNGTPVIDATCIRFSSFLDLPSSMRIFNTGYRYRIYKYNKTDNSFVSVSNWYTNTDQTLVNDTNYYYKITIATTDATSINIEDAIKKVKFVSTNDTIPVSDINAMFISSPDGRPINFDFVNSKITFPYDTCIIWKDKFYSIKNGTSDLIVDFSGAIGTTCKGYFNTKTNSFVFTNVSTDFANKDDCILFCTFRKGKWVSINANYTVNGVDNKSGVQEVRKSHVKSIAHQGYNVIAPPHTIPAYIEAKKHGFDVGECDVQWTSDGVPVLCHDPTIDATSDGTGTITAMSYEQLLQYDFGSWKSSAYTGTKIPTFYQFVDTCKLYGLDMYVECKDGYTKSRLQGLIDYLIKMDMLEKCTFISGDTIVLQDIKTLLPTSRMGYVMQEYNNGYVDYAVNNLKNGTNKVFLDIKYTVFTQAAFDYARQYGLGVEMWTIDDVASIKSLGAYCSGITSNKYTVSEALFTT